MRPVADPRQALPSVDAVVAAASRLAGRGSPRALLVGVARLQVEAARSAPPPAAGRAELTAALAAAVAAEAAALLGGELRPVINATGVLIQTNLGRSPLSNAALARAVAVAGGYSDLEYELGNGRRGERAGRLSRAFEVLTGSPALVVNNNAASLLLCLHTVARRREVIVSRGELVEIGGSFRLPDVMRMSGARLIEVGTTNRTRLRDYADVIGPRTAAILKVHRSNFEIVGFTESAPTAGLVELARERGVTFIEDLGSGSLLPTEAAGVAHEPTVQESLAAGVDLVCFSGDKLLGGPQAGIILGDRELVRRLGRDPLYRALRPDKLTLAALDATLAAYLAGTAATDLPLWRMLSMSAAATRKRARAWAAALPAGPDTEIVVVESAIGGGALPGQVLKGWGLALGVPGMTAASLAARLREGTPAVVARVHAGRVLLDPRAVAPDADGDLIAALAAAAGA